MRTVQDTSSWCVRGQNHRSPDTPPLSQVCTMAWRRLRALLPLLRAAIRLASETEARLLRWLYGSRRATGPNLSQCVIRGPRLRQHLGSFLTLRQDNAGRTRSTQGLWLHDSLRFYLCFRLVIRQAVAQATSSGLSFLCWRCDLGPKFWEFAPRHIAALDA